MKEEIRETNEDIDLSTKLLDEINKLYFLQWCLEMAAEKNDPGDCPVDAVLCEVFANIISDVIGGLSSIRFAVFND